MQDTIYSNALYQISEILNYVEKDLINKIPENLINYINQNKSKDYDWKIDTNLPLEKQELLQKTKEILTVIYRDYMCNASEREELDKTLNKNELKYQNELREKYNPDNLFKKREKKIYSEQVESEDTSMVVYKQSLFRKILNKIKLLLRR